VLRVLDASMYLNAQYLEIMFAVARHVCEIGIENTVLVFKFATIYNNFMSTKDKNRFFQ
jgi:hypothetical protein